MKNSKELKTKGKITVKAPNVKERKRFAPATKAEQSKKSYNRKKETFDEDEELGTVPMKPDHFDKKSEKFPVRKSAKDIGKNPTRKTAKQIRGEEDEEKKSCWKGYKKKGTKMKGDKKVNNCVKENTEFTNISKFVEAILTKNYASANKHLKQAVDTKLSKIIQSELNTPLF